jgi:putative ABC transport system permease protein
MVLVMLSSTTTLFAGEESAVKKSYPNCVNIEVHFNGLDGIGDENLDALRNDISEYSGDSDLTGLRTCAVAGLFTDDGILIDYSANVNTLVNYDDLGYLYVISLDDYNSEMNDSKTLSDGQCFIYSSRLDTGWDTFTVEHGSTYTVKERLTSYNETIDDQLTAMPSVYIVVSDLDAFARPLSGLLNSSGDSMVEYRWQVGLDTETSEEEAAATANVKEAIMAYGDNGYTIRSFDVRSREAQRDSFYSLYGSLFFLGIMLSVVFLIATVLIIYYKQISEGYEDQNRFEIMQKVGMTKREIRKSINSQMLTVFFLPLVMAGIHLAFAFPVISKLLVALSFDDTVLNGLVTLVSFAIFGLLYAAVYKITSGSYYAIVSGKKETV